MPSSPSPLHNTSSGITTTASGDRHIPSSTRPDGSKRKEIKIRPGYKPPEDVEVYKNRTAEAWKTRGAGAGVPGAAGLGLDHSAEKGVNTKNAKRREARKKARDAAAAAGEIEEGATNEKHEGEVTNETPVTNGTNAEVETLPPKSSSAKESLSEEAQQLSETIGPEAEKEKLARNLKKKLRQARELKDKKDKGENLLPEQFEKVIKINELIRQLDGLGLNAYGEQKDS
ncbi:hypothetical protein MMC07_004914 [Pseudocyphellaria aurata]|nr:hypothetical protein [Pseudocyphellaria aurata]